MTYDPVESAILRHNIAEDAEYREYQALLAAGYNEECEACFVNCFNCSFCSDLSYCKNCRGCSKLKDCANCNDTECGHDNFGCDNCTNCNNCVECIDCTNCESCMVCIDCDELKNSHHCYMTFGASNDEPMSFMWAGKKLPAMQWLKKYENLKLGK